MNPCSLQHRDRLTVCFLCLIALSTSRLSHAQGKPHDSATGNSGSERAKQLAQRILPLVKSHRGDVSVVIKNLDTGVSFKHRADVAMPTASLIKFPVMATAYQLVDEQKLNLDALIELTDDEKVPGSGILNEHFSAGTKLTVRDLIRLMIVYSDNTATNMVLDQIGLISTTERMARLGLKNTRINSKVFRRETSMAPPRSAEFGLGSTTANETVKLYELLHKQKLASLTGCLAMLEHLRLCEDRSKLARHLPSNVKIAHKSGAVASIRCDAGLIESSGGTIAICVLTNKNVDKRWHPDNAANQLCANIARRTYDFFNPKVAPTATPLVLKLGSNGSIVEDLQRTLNTRLEAKSKLIVDGEFGPATHQAVIEFQKRKNLKSTGIVDRPTWAALGTIVTTDAPVATPARINAEDLVKESPDQLEGPPFVTCKAWAFADGETGELLWGNRETDRLDFASTTKIMTAFVVCRLAKTNPEILDETVTFSARADNTGGSTSGIRAGEQLPVRELLYGLMLPSGNDASVALAEHFGIRFKPDSKHSSSLNPDEKTADVGHKDKSAYDYFIDEMNRTAVALGMQKTSYKNPHGLTARGHLSSASDLLKLAHASMSLPLFRHYVRTRQRGCELASMSGYRRNVLWKNTNRLLGIEGYSGIKTGTTSAAGTCLVSMATRGNDELLLVVLGAQSSAARYTDSRNLYRWAWQQRGHKK